MPNVSVPAAVTHQDQILERISNGEAIPRFASDYGVTPQAISHALAKHCPAEYQQALKDQAEASMQRYVEMLEDAPDGLSVSRARELLAHSRHVAAARNPAVWGNRPHTAVQVNGEGAQVRIVSWRDNESGQDTP